MILQALPSRPRSPERRGPLPVRTSQPEFLQDWSWWVVFAGTPAEEGVKASSAGPAEFGEPTPPRPCLEAFFGRPDSPRANPWARRAGDPLERSRHLFGRA